MVMSRGVGNVLLNFIIGMARDKGVALFAEFISTEKNRLMEVTYGFAGFKDMGETVVRGKSRLLRYDKSTIASNPNHITVIFNDAVVNEQKTL